MMDNRVFNVNGRGDEMLLKTLELVLEQASTKVCGWKVSPQHGLILEWAPDETSNKLPGRLAAAEVLPMVLAWLKSEEAQETELTRWDMNMDHDGDNVEGWRVYCEDWGHIDGSWRAICAIKRVHLWLGK